MGPNGPDLNESSVRSHLGLVFGVMSPQGDWAQRFSRFGEMGLTPGAQNQGNGYLYVKASSWSGAQVNEPGLLADLTGPNGRVDNEG